MTTLEQTRLEANDRPRGLISSRLSGARIDAPLFAPTAALRPFVECYWVSRWDLRGQAPHAVEMLGDPCVHIAFERGQSRVVGVCTRLWKRTLVGEGLIRAAKLQPGAACAFFAGPAHELTDRVLSLGAAWPQCAEFESRLLAIEDDAVALGALDEWLAARVRVDRAQDVSLAVALVKHVAMHAEIHSAEELARAAGISLRPLQRLFRRYVGASPKWVIRRHRLQEAAIALERGAGRSIADLAAQLGYSDHGHFTRDFKAATGRSPSVFARDVWTR